MDFIERIKDSVNSIDELPIKLRSGYLGVSESLVIYSSAGSTAIKEYMDGAKDVNMNYEIAMKSKDGDKLQQVLWLISEHLDKLKSVISQDDSFTFNKLTITSNPFINQYDEQGWLVFLLDFTANITIEGDL
ncbi:capsid protein [Carnobacterium maltaromaticum]|uniref:minor capsid protein n=1 Tax=Carnobacterium maltaromaticum TaxID=2751 RepID=UPI000C774A25|nr:minor capsid protein [Carnobacterium maltaromaticum]PLS36793.1 capsid protein [Carnobacterium maltaromaticum]PLS37608.1 capsid protein [Carnobacterium maltaromaticum]PLS39550.1 capsid protein [Carnobacterium maltaromaticum]PLS44305.1 capsid protein [Carnobacterium maltaromaticum]PLS47488.1 capsid protein [Carnobacterium maltaromaticum]